MKEKHKYLALIILEFLTFTLMVVGITFSICDVRFMGDYPRLSGLPIYMTFTGLSNIFIGLVCLACAIYRLVKKEKILPKLLFVLKIIALADISITFITTACYLAPSLGASWWRLYINNNIFNHFLTPVIAIVTFIIFEDYVEISKNYSYFALVPIILYGCLYVPNVYSHLNEDGSTNLTYDIYGFARFGPGVLVLFSLVFIGLSIGFTMLFWFINKSKGRKLISS